MQVQLRQGEGRLPQPPVEVLPLILFFPPLFFLYGRILIFLSMDVAFSMWIWGSLWMLDNYVCTTYAFFNLFVPFIFVVIDF